MCECTGDAGEAFSPPLPPRAVCESNVGGGYVTDVDLRIVMSCKEGARGGEKGGQRGGVGLGDGCVRSSYVPSVPTHRNPAASSRPLPCRRRACRPNRVPCTRLSRSEGRTPGARRDSGGTLQGQRGRPRARRARTAWWVVSTVGHPWKEDVLADYKCRYGNTHAPCCDGTDESVERSLFRPRRFAPARTPSGAVIRLIWCSYGNFGHG